VNGLDQYSARLGRNDGSGRRYLMTRVAEPTPRFKTGPHNVALERDFITIDWEGRPPDAFEKAMAGVESESVRPLIYW